MIKIYFILFPLLLPLILILPQEKKLNPEAVNYPVYSDQSKALISMKIVQPAQENEALESRVIPNQFRHFPNKNIVKNESLFSDKECLKYGVNKKEDLVMVINNKK